MQLSPHQKIEITHDILARKVYDRMDADEKMRLKIEQFLRDRFDYYSESGALLTKRDLNYIEPYLGKVDLAPDQKEFISESRKGIEAKLRKKRFLILGIGALLMLAALVSIGFALQAQKKEKQAIAAQKQAVEAQERTQKALEETERQKAVADQEKQEAERQRENAIFAQKVSDSLRDISQQAFQLARIKGLEAEEKSLEARAEALATHALLAFDQDQTQGFNLAQASMALMPSDRVLAVWNNFLSDPGTYFYKNILRGHSGKVSDVAYSPDGKNILTGSSDGFIRIWDAKNGESIKVICCHNAPITSVAYAPNGKHIVSASLDGSVEIWDGTAENGNEWVESLEDEDYFIFDAVFAPDGKHVLTASGDSTARIWEVESASLLKSLVGHQHVLRSVTYSPDGTLILTGSEDGTAKIWDTQTTELIRTLEGHNGGVHSATFSPDGKYILTGSVDRTARIWDTSSGKLIRILSETALDKDAGKGLSQSHPDAINKVTFSSDGRFELNVGSGNVLEISYTGYRTETLEVGPANDYKIALRIGRSLPEIVLTKDGLAIPNPNRPKEKDLHGLNTQSLRSVAFSPTENKMLSIRDDGVPRIQDVESGKILQELKGLPISQATYSQDGKHILTASYEDAIARIWNVESGEVIDSLSSYSGILVSIAYSPDGKTILTGSSDGTARLWDVSSGQTLGTMNLDSGSVSTVTFSPDGRFIFIGTEGGVGRVYRNHLRALEDGQIYKFNKLEKSLYEIDWKY